MLSSLKVVETYFIGTFSEATDYINSFHKSDSNSGWLQEKHELYLCAMFLTSSIEATWAPIETLKYFWQIQAWLKITGPKTITRQTAPICEKQERCRKATLDEAGKV